MYKQPKHFTKLIELKFTDKINQLYCVYIQAGPTGGVARIEMLFKFAKYLVSERVSEFGGRERESV